MILRAHQALNMPPRRAIEALSKIASVVIFAHLVLNVRAGLIKRREINADPGFRVANATSDPAMVRGGQSGVDVPSTALSQNQSVIKTTRLTPQSTAFNDLPFSTHHHQLSDEGKRGDLPAYGEISESAIHNGATDGLDSFESILEKNGVSNIETTEESLVEIENVAAKTTVSNTTTDGRSMYRSDEIYDEDTESEVGTDTKVKSEPIKSTEETEAMRQGIKDMVFVATLTTKTENIPNGHALYMTTEVNNAATQQSNVQFVQTDFALSVTTTPKSTPVLVEQSNEESNEVRLQAPNTQFVGNSTYEKRGKFINDNSTNAHQLNLPNVAEIWSLAAMKSLPPNDSVIESITRKPFSDDLASNSEKNILDWSQIMTSNLDGEKNEKNLGVVAVNTSSHGNLDSRKHVHEEEKQDDNDQLTTTVSITNQQPNTNAYNGDLLDNKANTAEESITCIENKSNTTKRCEQFIDNKSNVTEQAGNLFDKKSNMMKENGQLIDNKSITDQHAQLIENKSIMAEEHGQLIDNKSNQALESGNLNETKIEEAMLHREFEGSTANEVTKKPYEKLNEEINDRPTTAPHKLYKLNDTILLDESVMSNSSNASGNPLKSKENLDYRMEILLNSTLASTDKANKLVTTFSNFGSPLIKGENEVLLQTTPQSAVPSETEIPGPTKNLETTMATVALSVPKVTLTTTIPIVDDKNNETLSADKRPNVGDTSNPTTNATPLESKLKTSFASFHEYEMNIAIPTKAAEEKFPQIPVRTTAQATVETMRLSRTKATESATDFLATPAPNLNILSNSSSNEATLNPNKNKSDVGHEGGDAAGANDVHASHDEQQLVTTSSAEPEKVSTFQASNANTSAIVERDQKYGGGIYLGKPTVATILAIKPVHIGIATTEVGPIDDKINVLNANIENQDVVSSTIKTHLAIKGEGNETGSGEPTTTTSASSANEFLISTKKTITTSDKGVDWLTTPATETENKEEPKATTLETPVVDTKTTEKVKQTNSHETESSIETNVIDPFDKQAPTTATAKVTAARTNTELLLKENPTNDLEEKDKEERLLENEDKFALETTPESPKMNSTTIKTTTPSTTSTAETLAISLLDDSTSSTRYTSTTTSSTTTSSTTTATTTATPTSFEEVSKVAAPTTTTQIPSTTASATTSAYTTESEDTVHIPDTSTSVPLLPTIITQASTTMLPRTNLTTSETITQVPPLMAGAGNIHPNSAEGHETDVNAIIAISVSVIGVVALILLVAFLYLMRKRQKQMSYGQRCRPVSLDAYSLDNVSVLDSVRRKGILRASKRSYGNAAFDDPSLRHNLLTAAELGKFVERRSSIFEEFRDVPQITARADEVPTGCEDKNRYANVIPLPETRVVLQQQNGDDKTEYINANYVRGPKDAPNYYIACQAPLEMTVADFWRMVWEQQSRVIIQATDLIENGIEKCAEYLPPSVTLDNHTTYGDYQVTLRNREVKDKYAISTLALKNTIEDRSRELAHYWYKWPEAGVPAEEAPIIAMLLEARSSLKSYAVEQVNDLKEKTSTLTVKVDEIKNSESQPTSPSKDSPKKKEESIVSNGEINGDVDNNPRISARSQGPLIIHCSPGTGRTGTIIACDMAIRSLEIPKRSVDIPQIVYYVRRGRASAVQTKEQYEFIYKVANMYATKITNLSNDN